MNKLIMIFASMSGNTEEMALAVEKGLREGNADVTVKEVFDANASELLEYDGIVLGAYTWGDGELPDEFLDFYEEMDELDLSGKKAVVFGSCDSGYPAYGAAVDLLIDKLKERGASVVADGLKVELSPSEAEKEQCRELGRSLFRS
ncbi:flavodoxin [Paenibacillus selenitireducens]|uniref:Flavodoxin n=1 Tax=Paenibacillus selenitireducens TaxID=1324314 RepID=A0A1T2X0Z7_9BACL|nr:flavodoxin [Paenibacillus selenitireducens]OPA73243.1 flavodoxin [Paenibacillus selenitireducens]